MPDISLRDKHLERKVSHDPHEFRTDAFDIYFTLFDLLLEILSELHNKRKTLNRVLINRIQIIVQEIRAQND